MDEIKAGDVITWRTWSGDTQALVEWIRDGHAGIKSSDGYSSFHERIPNSARKATPAECERFLARLKPDRPIAYE